jgi:hypothetical protein
LVTTVLVTPVLVTSAGTCIGTIMSVSAACAAAHVVS